MSIDKFTYAARMANVVSFRLLLVIGHPSHFVARKLNFVNLNHDRHVC
jgi:hypothetical protein